jgi:hypothetical protein
MSIKVTMTGHKQMCPLLVEFSHVKQNFTKKAAIELKNKLRLALDELEIAEATDKEKNQ